MKKFLALAVAVLMVLAMSSAVFATPAQTGSITIQNATSGKTYAAYKVFDATFAGNNVSYTYTKTGDTDALYDALENGITVDGVTTASPFALTATTTANLYNVAQTGSDQDVIDFLNLLYAQGLLGSPVATETATSSTVTLNVPYGYYYITSTLGTTATVNTAAPNVTVIDKNEEPGFKPNQGKKIVVNGQLVDSSTVGVGEVVSFDITANCPQYDGTTQVTYYTITDTLAAGFTYNNDMVVTLGGQTLTVNPTVTVNNNGTTTIEFTFDPRTITPYPGDPTLHITYTATVDADVAPDNTNDVTLTWNTDHDDDHTDSYSYGFNLVKIDGTTHTQLDGAHFRLYDAQTGGNEIPVVWDSTINAYRVATAGETGVDIVAGNVTIFGLDVGTYWLEETQAPAGYNPLTSRVQVDVVAGTANPTTGILNTPVEVANNTGSQLPSTGGIGTTIFYVVGGLMMAAAVVLLVTRKKMSVED